MIRVESMGSFWFIDEDRMVYLRTPKEEGPRPEHHSVGVMADLVWHPYADWEINAQSGRLRITTTEERWDKCGPVIITAPDAVVRDV